MTIDGWGTQARDVVTCHWKNLKHKRGGLEAIGALHDVCRDLSHFTAAKNIKASVEEIEK